MNYRRFLVFCAYGALCALSADQFGVLPVLTGIAIAVVLVPVFEAVRHND